MNCRGFQHRLYEYLDGALSPGAQAAAEKHLSGCTACRKALRTERQAAQFLSDKFRQSTDSLQLPPEVQHRVLAGLADQRRAPAGEQGSLLSWGRWEWPVGLAASVLLLLAGVFFYVKASRPPAGPSLPHFGGAGIQVQFSYVVPTYTFRQEGGFVVDALIYQTNVVNERLPAELARLK